MRQYVYVKWVDKLKLGTNNTILLYLFFFKLYIRIIKCMNVL